MILAKKRSIDIFKERTLNCLSLKHEETPEYPITDTDLIRVNKCSVCGSKRATVLSDIKLNGKLTFFSTCVCNDCLFVFRSVSPSLQWFEKCWKIIETDDISVFNPETEAIRKTRYENYLSIISGYFSTGNVLDVGAGYGTGCCVFRDNGYDVEALEPEINKSKYIKGILGIRVHQQNIETFLSPLPEKYYDLIILAHCLEHLDDPRAVLNRLKKLLRPKTGIIYIEVPDLRNYVTWTDALYLTHKGNYNAKNLACFVHNCGFIIKERVRPNSVLNELPNLGLVAQVNHRFIPKTTPRISQFGTREKVTRIFSLYLKNLPVANMPIDKFKLTYSVPRIDQFYCTLRFERYTLIQSPKNPNLLTFRSALNRS